MSQKTLEQHIKEKMEGYAPSDCPDIWSNLEAALNAEEKRKKITPWWIVSIAASLILVATAGLLMFNIDKEDAKIASFPIKNDTIQQIVDTQIRPELPFSEPITVASAIVPTSVSSRSTRPRPTVQPSDPMKASYRGEPLLESIATPPPTEEEKTLVADPQSKQTKSMVGATISDATASQAQTKKTIYSNLPNVSKKSVDKSLSLALATNNSVVNISQRSNTVTTLYKSADRRLMGLMQLTNTEPPRTELQHYQPITASLTARKRLSDRFSVETGLSYSYLYSKTKTDIGIERKESQELHYIGVPVSGIIDIVKGKQWSIYAKAGGQIDVNIAGKWREKWRENDREFASATANDLEKKPQFSAHLAIGLGYKMSQKMMISLEPGANYYFDNKSEVENIHKERPLSGSINIAVSYLF